MLLPNLTGGDKQPLFTACLHDTSWQDKPDTTTTGKRFLLTSGSLTEFELPLPLPECFRSTGSRQFRVWASALRCSGTCQDLPAPHPRKRTMHETEWCLEVLEGWTVRQQEVLISPSCVSARLKDKQEKWRSSETFTTPTLHMQSRFNSLSITSSTAPTFHHKVGWILDPATMTVFAAFLRTLVLKLLLSTL